MEDNAEYNAQQTLKQVAHMLGVKGNLHSEVLLAVRTLQVKLRDGVTYDCQTHGLWNANKVSGCPTCVRDMRKRIAELEHNHYGK